MCRRKISILNTKYNESSFENFRVQKNDIMITIWFLKIILISRTMNIITWKEYLRYSYYEYELTSNLATRRKNQNIHSRFFI